MDPEERERAKQQAGVAAAEAVADGMVVGLGSGTTAAAAIRALGRRVDAGLDIIGVPTSYQSRQVAVDAGLTLSDIGERATIDMAIDGADQVVEDIAVKGGGGAHTLEKVVDAAADSFHLVIDRSKLAEAITHSIPVAVVPEARGTAAAAVRDLGGEPTLRAAKRKAGPVVTDEGHLILDCDFGTVTDPESLATALASCPGVVEHGLFVGLADRVYVGHPDNVEKRKL